MLASHSKKSAVSTMHDNDLTTSYSLVRSVILPPLSPIQIIQSFVYRFHAPLRHRFVKHRYIPPHLLLGEVDPLPPRPLP